MPHHPKTSSTLCKMPHLKNKQNKNTNRIISTQDYHLTQPCTSEEKQTNKTSAQISHYMNLKQTTGATISQFSFSVMFDSLRHDGLKHIRAPCLSPTPEFTQTHVHWVSYVTQPSHPLSSPSSPGYNLSQHQALSKCVSSLHQMAKLLSFSFSISPSNEYSGLIFFRMDWLDLLAVQGADSQESSPTPVQNINYSVLSFLYTPTLTSIHDYWKNHSLD